MHRDLSSRVVVAATTAEGSASVAANLAGSGQAGALIKGSLHTESHARMFGLSLGALVAACLVLNAASPSTRLCQHSARDFDSTGTHSISASTSAILAPGGGMHVDPFGTIHSQACATNQGGEEPGY